MKLVTHAAFSAGAVFAVATRILRVDPPLALLLAALSVVLQYVIDGLSHSESGGYVRRTPLLHSPSGSLASTAVYVALVLAVARDWTLVPPALLCGLLSSYTHLLLDAITERGIYVRGRRTARRRLARSDNPALNALFLLLGLALFLSALPSPSL